MDRLLMKKLEMGARVREFQRAHPYTDRNQAAVGRRFEERLAEAQSLFVQVNDARIAFRADAQHRQAMRRELAVLVRNVARIGQLAADDDARIASLFKPSGPANGNVAFVAHAKSLLEVATEHQDFLIRNGLLRPQLPALAKSLAAFTAVMEEAPLLDRELHLAQTALKSAMNDLAKLLRKLDVFQNVRFADDADVLATWTRLRVVATPTVRGERAEDAANDPAADAGPTAPRGGSTDPLPGDGQSRAA